MKKPQNHLMDTKLLLQILKITFYKLLPKFQFYKPVMFVTYIGAILTSLYIIQSAYHDNFTWFELQLALWLWFTVLFANFAEAFAESRGKAHADTLKQAKINTYARHLEDGLEIKKPASQLKKGDIVVCETGDMIPADGEVIEGIASVDESAITGESAPVIRESGGDRSAVTVGTRLLSDRIVMRVTSEPGKSFLDRMIALIEGSQRQKTPNEIALSVLLSSLTFVFLLTVISLKLFTNYSLIASNNSSADRITVPVLIALLVCLIPTTISALMTAVGIAGIDRLTRFNVIAKSGRAVEASGDIDLLIVDKTGTITLGNRLADEFIPIEGVTETQLADIAQLASLSDETPEGRSIVILAKSRYGLRGENIRSTQTQFFPFTAKQRMSGIDILGDNNTVIQSIRKGSPDAIKKHIESAGGFIPPSIDSIIQKVAQQGGTPLLVSENKQILGVIFLKDMIKGGIKNRFKEFRNGGIHTLMITGDNPLTAAAIAAEAGIDDFVAEATPEDKLKIIRKAQNEGHLVAMTGDGTNDAPALAQADVGVAMNSGTAATREAGNMVDLDNNPLKLIEIVKIGKQMLITRGALTTFSMCNDIAKYFAIIPALFKNLYPSENGVLGPLRALDIMHLHTTESAILSAVIFNALVIIALIPLALRGVHFKVQKASSLLKRNLLIYGLGGVMIPFIGIKLIDMLITSIGLL